jgi:hypothetical protein
MTLPGTDASAAISSAAIAKRGPTRQRSIVEAVLDSIA